MQLIRQEVLHEEGSAGSDKLVPQAEMARKEEDSQKVLFLQGVRLLAFDVTRR